MTTSSKSIELLLGKAYLPTKVVLTKDEMDKVEALKKLNKEIAETKKQIEKLGSPPKFFSDNFYYANIGVSAAPIYTDRSRHETGLNCERLRYFTYHMDGSGYVPAGGALALIFGNAMHDGISKMLLDVHAHGGHNLDAIIQECSTNFHYNLSFISPNWAEHTIKEQQWLLTMLLHLWRLVELPKYAPHTWRLICTEKEFTVKLSDDVFQMVRLDAVLQRKSDGYFFVLEHKTTKAFSHDWFEQWQTNLQVVLNYNACRKEFSPLCGGVIICGIAKGRLEKDKSSNSAWNGKVIQNTPLCYYWVKNGEVLLSWKAGAERKAWYEAEGTTPKALAETLISGDYGFDMATKIFATTEALAPTDAVVNDTIAHVVKKERAFRESLKIPNIHAQYNFARNFSQCNKFGAPCSMKQLCYANPAEQEELLKNGTYVIRPPHHATELEVKNESTSEGYISPAAMAKEALNWIDPSDGYDFYTKDGSGIATYKLK